MRRAGQTPHGARPNREGFPSEASALAGTRAGSARHTLRVGRLSLAVMRGQEECPSRRKADRIRLTGPAATTFSSSELLILPDRLALFQKGVEPFGGIFGSHQFPQIQLFSSRNTLGEGLTEGAIYGSLGQPFGGGAPGPEP